MERKKEERKKVQFIKKGGGSHRYKTSSGKMKIVKPGEKFWEYPEYISENIRDIIAPVDKNALEEDTAALNAQAPTFTVKRRSPTSPWYDVVDDNGKVMNEKALKHQDALNRVEDLS